MALLKSGGPLIPSCNRRAISIHCSRFLKRNNPAREIIDGVIFKLVPRQFFALAIVFGIRHIKITVSSMKKMLP